MVNNLKPENISIVFTAYNILPYLQLAVYSLLEQYPKYYNSIIIFNDQSDDGTIEWLEKESLNHITWENENNYLVNFSDLKKLYSNNNDTGLNASYRNSVMVHNIFKQIKTPYIMLNDADIIFTPNNNNWLESYDTIINDYPIIAPKEHFYYNWNLYQHLMPEKYIKRLMGKYHTLYHFDKNTNTEYMERLQFFHSIIDLNYFKNYNLLFDDIRDADFIKLIYDVAKMDTGSQFSWEIFNRNIPYYEILPQYYYNRWTTHLENYLPFTEYEYHQSYVYHARWISSLKRMEHDYPENKINQHTLTKINMDFKTNKLLYNYVKYIHEKYKTEYPTYYLDI